MAKKLLEEATVRRFMKIAGIKSLNENFAQELEEEVVEEMYKEEEEPVMEAGDMEEMPGAPEDGEEMAPEDGEEMAPEEGEGEEEEVELEVEGGKDEAVELLAKLADMLGVEVEVEGDEGGEEPEMPEEPSDEEMPKEPAPEGEEEVMEEGEHMEEPAKDPAGHSLENPPLVDDADSRDPNQNPSMTMKGQDPMKASGEHMAESREAFKKRLVEQVAKRVAARLKNLK